MARNTQQAVVFAQTDLVTSYPQGTVVLREGEPWDPDDPVVKDHPEWFGEECTKLRRSVAPVPA